MPPNNIANVPRETRERLEYFVGRLLEWQKRINLISGRDVSSEEVWQRHILDSLQLASLVPLESSRLADLGSGGGFPGLVLACSLPCPVHLIESDHRKAAFLQTIATELSLNVTVHKQRIETVTETFPVVTARAVAPLSRLLGWVEPIVTSSSLCLFPKGRNWSMELEEAESDWDMEVEALPSTTDAEARILRIRQLQKRVKA